MSTKDFSCFFITPIGAEESEERKNMERVLKVLIQPVLLQCGFKSDSIVVSHTIATPTITQPMLTHLESDDLCIADITGTNPNVMYELGYRKGLNKPVIIITSDKDNLPFDVYDYRVITYDLSSIDTLMKAQEELRKQILYWKDQGFVKSEGSGSVSDILNKLKSIENKLDQTLANVGRGGGDAVGDVSANKVIRELGSVISAFNFALRTRNIGLAEALLPRIEQQSDKKTYLDMAVSQVTAMGSPKAASILKAEWDYIKTFTVKQQYEEISAYVSYCNRRDCEEENMEFLEGEINRLLEIAESDEQKAGLYNQLNRLHYGIYATKKKNGESGTAHLSEAIESLKEATRLNPKEASYFYNLAVCYQAMDDNKNAKKVISNCWELNKDDPKPDADHLELAYELFRDTNDPRAKDVMNLLTQKFPMKASTL